MLLFSIIFILTALPNEWFDDCIFPIGEPIAVNFTTSSPPNEISSYRHEIPHNVMKKIYRPSLAECDQRSDLFCKVVNQTEKTYDRSIRYFLYCFCPVIKSATLWDSGFNDLDLRQYHVDLDHFDFTPIRKYHIRKVNIPLASACGLTIAAIGSVVSLISAMVAVKIKPELRMSAVFHLTNNIVALLDLVLALTCIFAALRIFYTGKPQDHQCKSALTPFYMALVATACLFVCWVASLLLAGFSARLRQKEYIQKQRVFISAQICSRQTDRRINRPNSVASNRIAIFGSIFSMLVTVKFGHRQIWSHSNWYKTK